jgi:phosphoribosylformylglycinamidine (FGAM) synthase PurS component
MIVECAVDLTIPDNTAYTVLVALRDLGYAALTRVERTDLYRLDLPEDGRLSRDAVARAISRAEVIFNPNKHRLSIIDPEPVVGQASLAPTLAPSLAHPAQYEAVVTDRDDDSSKLTRLLAERFRLTGLRSVEQAVAWRLFEADAPAASERLEWACRALLCNPHSQSSIVRIRPERIPVGDGAVVVET